MSQPLIDLITQDNLSTIDLDQAIIMVWALDGSRILAVSKPALRLFNAFHEDEITGRRFGPALQSTTKISSLARMMAVNDPARVERLRLFVGVQSEVITCLCQKIVLKNGSEAMMLTARGQKLATPRWSGAVDMFTGKTTTTLPVASLPVKNVVVTAPDKTIPLRFMFEINANLKITSVSEQLKQAFQLTDSQLIGRDFNDIARDFAVDGTKDLNQKLSARQTWQGVTLLWSLPDEQKNVPVELSGLPILSQQREFLGFRGFGLIRFDRVEDAQKPNTQKSEALTTTMEAFKIERQERLSQNERLSQSERNAFREIAKVLGAEVLGAGENTSKQVPLAIPEDVVQSEVSAWHQDTVQDATKIEIAKTLIEPAILDRSLLDRLPIGVLIMRNNQALFLNKTLLDLLDYHSLVEFNTENALATLFADEVQPKVDEMAIYNTHLRARSDEIITVAAHLQTIEYEHQAATLVSFRRALSEVQTLTEVQAAPKLQLIPSATPDIETQLQLREAMRERDEMRAVLDTATDGVISLNSECQIIGLSRSAEALFGVTQNECAGERLSSLLAGDSHATAMDYFEGVKQGGVASLLNDGREVVGREKKGGRIPLFMTLGRISDHANGKFCAVLRDLTAWKKAEAELTESRRVAERASAMKSDFLAKISHEIRTPMNAIIGFAEVMKTEQLGPIGNERYKEYLGDIHRSGEHVVSLVNDLLDLSKIEAGQADLSFTSVDLNAVVRDCVSMMQPQATREKVIIRTSMTDKLPAVVADARSVKQVLLNLLSNGTKFNQPGGQVVVSTALNDEGEAVIRVRDTGIGMNDKEMEAAMQPFRQVSVSRKGGGTGLGLPLTKALVEANRASLLLKSTPNEGTLAEVVFPATRVLAE